MTEREAGQTVTEYAILLGFLAIAIIVAVFLVSGRVVTLFSGEGEPSVYQEIDRRLQELPLANVAFNAPTTLRLHDSADIQLLVSLDVPLADLRAELEEVGEREGARVKVSPIMEARLTGSGFEITMLTPDRQPIGARDVTEWRWEIEAAKGGLQRLHLTLSALIEVDDQPSQRAVRVFERVIDVRITLGERVTGFVADNWQWLWATVLVPLVLWLWRFRKRRRRPPEYGWPTY